VNSNAEQPGSSPRCSKFAIQTQIQRTKGKIKLTKFNNNNKEIMKSKYKWKIDIHEPYYDIMAIWQWQWRAMRNAQCAMAMASASANENENGNAIAIANAIANVFVDMRMRL
jgi:hypothetical protein